MSTDEQLVVDDNNDLTEPIVPNPPDPANPPTPPSTPNLPKRFDCPSCGAALSSKRNLAVHTRSHCPINGHLINNWCIICRKKVAAEECEDHFQVEHDVVVEKTVVTSGVESTRKHQIDQMRIGYRMSLDDHIRSAVHTKTYVCSKSQPITKPRKSDKIQVPADRGLLREAITCSAHLRTLELPNGNAIVEFCGTHTHEPDINWSSLDPDTENTIADFLKDGRSTKFIVEHFRALAHANTGPIRRSDCVDSTDVSNVKARRVGKPNQLDPDDLISTKLVIDQLQQQTPNPIFHFDASEGAIGIATPNMKRQFHRHAARAVFLVCFINYKPALVSPTPTLAGQYSRYGRTLPHALTSSTTMTDDAMATWNAWQPIFVLSRLGHRLCLWHIRRAWKTKLKSLLGEASPLYKMAKGIMQKLATSVPTKEQFDFTSNQMLESLRQHGHADAADYLLKQYLSRANLWALYNHINDFASTNMFLESMHNKVKTVVMGRRTNYRGDELIVSVLLPFAKNIELENTLHKTRKGFSWQSRVKINIRRHKQAIDYIKTAGGFEQMRLSIKVKDDKTYVMKSKSALDIKHTITVNEECIGKCSSKCSFRDACGSLCQCRMFCTCDIGLGERWQSSCVHCHVVAMIFKRFPCNDEHHDQQMDVIPYVQSEIVVDEPSTSRAPVEKDEYSTIMTTMQSCVNAMSHREYDDQTDMQDLRETMARLQVSAEKMGVTQTATMYGKRYSKPVSNRMEVQVAFKSKKKRPNK